MVFDVYENRKLYYVQNLRTSMVYCRFRFRFVNKNEIRDNGSNFIVENAEYLKLYYNCKFPNNEYQVIKFENLI